MTGKRVKLTVIAVLAGAALILCVIFFPKILAFLAGIVRLFLPFVLGYFFSVAVNPLADLLGKRFHLPRAASAVVVILLVLGVLGSIVGFAIAKLVGEVRSIYDNLPAIYVNFTNGWQEISAKLSNVYDKMPVGVQSVLDDFSNDFFTSLSGLAKPEGVPIFRSAGNMAKSVPSIFISSIVFLLASFFMISDAKTVRRAISGIFSKSFYDKLSAAKTEIKRYVGGYVKAQLIIMIFTFTILFVGFKILGINYSLLIALGTAVFDALPFFGSGAVLWTWAAVSFLSSEFSRGVGLIIIYLCVIFTRQMIEPKIVSKNIGLNPILTLMAMYVGYRTLSIGGMMFGPLLLMLAISLYRAGVFDPLIEFLRDIKRIIYNEIQTIKQQFKE